MRFTANPHRDVRGSLIFGRLAGLARVALLALAIVAAAHPALAQPAVTATSGSPQAIARIRELYATIQREAPGYRRTEHELYEFSLEGGVLHGFYRGRELRKLVAELYGETWRGRDEYYFADGRPVFIYVVLEIYDELLSGRVQHRLEYRYYFDGGRLIRQVTPRHPPDVAEHLSPYDPEVPALLENARLFAACAAAPAEPDRPECTAPQR